MLVQIHYGQGAVFRCSLVTMLFFIGLVVENVFKCLRKVNKISIWTVCQLNPYSFVFLKMYCITRLKFVFPRNLPKSNSDFHFFITYSTRSSNIMTSLSDNNN